MFKIILISVASVGNIDRRLLAEGVGQIGPLEFDPYPTIHLRDLVAHEAHRHPYIEILGTVYLMKLRYSERFGSRSGSAWRLMFVYALLPWMHQYRIPDEAADKKDKSFDSDEVLEEKGITPRGGRRLPSLRRDSPSDARGLAEENRRLREMLDKLLAEKGAK